MNISKPWTLTVSKELAMPYVTETIHREMDFDKILSMVKTRIELFTEIPGHIDFF